MKESDNTSTSVKKGICSSCGLCSSTQWPMHESIQSCVFKNGWLGESEKKLFGRQRDLHDPVEMRFGITLGSSKNLVVKSHSKVLHDQITMLSLPQ
ncbi:hypothetical protein CR161_08970 [Prosthecochloris sp. ZM]|uniref:hypothetical protein n=1 Tax=Prosthecochloris sp. ZM TaxID=2283143 RepID=UPI000E181DAC|nr:hypothetical protein [Prosthecochloris sp. ZM]RDD30816.1 hypothetical protein CR161_08970 [Prosthecochloris sp. ZM]